MLSKNVLQCWVDAHLFTVPVETKREPSALSHLASNTDTPEQHRRDAWIYVFRPLLCNDEGKTHVQAVDARLSPQQLSAAYQGAKPMLEIGICGEYGRVELNRHFRAFENTHQKLFSTFPVATELRQV